ncbi:PAS domain-containing protein [Faunimonas sp. B44]
MKKPDPAVNNFQHGMPDTAARTRSEGHIASVREQDGVFVDAVRLTRMPMLVTDATLPGNPITFANEAFSNLSGYTVEEMLGQDPHFMNGEETDPEAIRRYEEAIREGRDENLEIVQYRKNETPFRAMLFASPLDDGPGHGHKPFSLLSRHHEAIRGRSGPFGRSLLSWRDA